jgi:hypothetical protein
MTFISMPVSENLLLWHVVRGMTISELAVFVSLSFTGHFDEEMTNTRE